MAVSYTHTITAALHILTNSLSCKKKHPGIGQRRSRDILCNFCILPMEYQLEHGSDKELDEEQLTRIYKLAPVMHGHWTDCTETLRRSHFAHRCPPLVRRRPFCAHPKDTLPSIVVILTRAPPLPMHLQVRKSKNEQSFKQFIINLANRIFILYNVVTVWNIRKNIHFSGNKIRLFSLLAWYALCRILSTVRNAASVICAI